MSGLLICGCCDGKYSIIGKQRYGCRNHFRQGTCSNNRTIRRDLIEQRVLAGLREKLVSPDSVADGVRAFIETKNRENHERRAQGEIDRQALAKIDRSTASLIKAIEDGMYQPAMKTRMEELEAKKSEIEARLREAPVDLPDVNPNVAEHYRREIARIPAVLAGPGSHRDRHS